MKYKGILIGVLIALFVGNAIFQSIEIYNLKREIRDADVRGDLSDVNDKIQEVSDEVSSIKSTVSDMEDDVRYVKIWMK